MCGASDQQNALEASTSNFATMLNSHYAANYGKQSTILQNLSDILTPIAEAGPDQQGFGTNELAATETQARETVGSSYAKASQNLNNTLAAQGGGNEALPTGASAALKGQLASAGANALSSEELGITEANYAQGRQNWSNATAGLNALGNDYNPNAVASVASAAGSAAYGEAEQNAMQGFQQFNDIASGIGALAGAGVNAAKTGVGLAQFGSTGSAPALGGGLV